MAFISHHVIGHMPRLLFLCEALKVDDELVSGALVTGAKLLSSNQQRINLVQANHKHVANY